jgi:hypothetical protein
VSAVTYPASPTTSDRPYRNRQHLMQFCRPGTNRSSRVLSLSASRAGYPTPAGDGTKARRSRSTSPVWGVDVRRTSGTLTLAERDNQVGRETTRARGPGRSPPLYRQCGVVTKDAARRTPPTRARGCACSRPGGERERVPDPRPSALVDVPSRCSLPIRADFQHIPCWLEHRDGDGLAAPSEEAQEMSPDGIGLSSTVEPATDGILAALMTLRVVTRKYGAI